MPAMARAAVMLLAPLLLWRCARGWPAAALRPAARAFVPKDLLTTYHRFIAFPGSEVFCPTSITHSSFSGGAGRVAVAHADIAHAGTQCTSSGEMLVVPAGEAIEEPPLKALLESDSSGVVAAAFESVLKSSESLVGYEAEKRVCGEAQAVGVAAETAFLFVHEEKNDVTLIEDVAVLLAGPRYLVLLAVKNGSNLIGCAYSDEAQRDPAESGEPAATGTGTADEEENTEKKESGSCFPGDATVELASGAVARMDEVAVGDVVKVGSGELSRVFMFTHKSAGVESDFIALETATGARVVLTNGHYIYANGELIAAGAVRAGDVLALAEGGESRVVTGSVIRGRGLYNPQTLHGDVAVNGVVASTYTTAVEPALAHAVLAPLRAMSDYFSVCVTSLRLARVITGI